MSRRYKPYLEHKNSGVEWLGRIPIDWIAIPIKRVSEIFNGATPKSAVATYWDGDISWVTPADLGKSDTPYISEGTRSITLAGYESCGTSLVPAGSVILSSRAPIGTLGIADKDLCTNQGCKSLVVKKECYNKYLYYVLASSAEQLNLLGRGTTFLELSADELGFYKIGLPPIYEQKCITNFLDQETAKIDSLIEKQERLIQLLKEKRQAVISHAVTKGLNPKAQMRDSGVEWLGQVPEHWDVVAIKHIVEIPVTDGPHETPNFLDNGVPFISAEAVSSGQIDFEKIRAHISEEDNARFSKKYFPRKYDIYMVKSGATTGVTAIVEIDTKFNIWSPLAVIRCGKDSYPYFVLNFLRSLNFQQGVELNWSFGTQQNIGMGVIENLYVTRPPIDEARLIASDLVTKCSKYDAIIDQAYQQIELSKERRTALISAAVTGKIDVRNWAAPNESHLSKEQAA